MLGYETQYDTTEYFNFIEICKVKIYSDNETTQLHHIIPKYLKKYVDFDVNFKDNIIKISINDHYLCHLILAHCYPINHDFHAYNINACIMILHGEENKIYNSKLKKEYWTAERRLKRSEDLKKFYQTERGIEARKIMSEKHKGKVSYWPSAETKKKISETLLKETNISRGMKRLPHVSEICRKLMNERIAKGEHPMLGKTHSNETKLKMCKSRRKRTILRPCIINDILYDSPEIASIELNIHVSTLKSRLKSNTINWSNWNYYEENE